MFRKLLLAAAALALSAPVLADPHRKSFDSRHFDRGHHHGHRHHHYAPPRRVVVMPPPRVYYAPPPRVVYAPAPVYHYYPSLPPSGISIRFNIPF